MSAAMPNRVAVLFFSTLLLGLAPGPGGPLTAQELDLKRQAPGGDSVRCPPFPSPLIPDPEEEAEAGRLASSAGQALILGDTERAREFLARATELDPSSAELAYRYGRILEDLQETMLAIEQFCRALALGSEGPGLDDARSRLEALGRARHPQIPPEANNAFLNGLLQADQRRWAAAEQAFGLALQSAPALAEAVYNRGVIRSRMGNAEGAVADFQQYLALRPDAADAILVSRRIGQLQAPGSLPGSGATLTLGLLFPGMGQFYSGRALGGLTVLGLAGGAAAAGILIEEVTVQCVGSVPPGGTCPPDRYIGETAERPYLIYGLAAAGAIAFVGAVEAFVRVRAGRTRVAEGSGRGPSGLLGAAGPDEELLDLATTDAGNPLDRTSGSLRILGPTIQASGSRLNLNLLRISF
jgi:tetratricopeptide (TPR) repeat protein